MGAWGEEAEMVKCWRQAWDWFSFGDGPSRFKWGLGADETAEVD